MAGDSYPSASPAFPPYRIFTVRLPSPLAGEPPTPIATLLPTSLSSKLSDTSNLPSNSTPYPSDPSYEILDTPTKGFGMFAKRIIQPGQLILDEHPVLIVPELPLPHDSRAWDDLGNDLPAKERAEMLTMANCRPAEECPSPVEGIVRTNALILELFPVDTKTKGKRQPEEDSSVRSQRFGGVFLKINRCNHSCGPNAAHKWDARNLSSKLYALRVIEPGEEITIFYTDVTNPRDVRRAELEKNHRFLCSCRHCVPEQGESDAECAQIRESDDNRHQLRHWLSTHPSYLKWSTDLCRADDTVVSSHREALSLIDKENAHFLQHVFLEELALCNAILGDEKEFRYWATEFIQKCRIEDPERAKEFEVWLEDPTRYKKWAWRRKQREMKKNRPSSPVDGYSSWLF